MSDDYFRPGDGTITTIRLRSIEEADRLPSSGNFSTGILRVITLVNEMIEQKEFYEQTARLMQPWQIGRDVYAQLSPGQSVLLKFETNEQGSTTLKQIASVDRPGNGYLTASEPHTSYQEVSRPSDLCYVPGGEPQPKQNFKISDAAGKREVHLDSAASKIGNESNSPAPNPSDKQKAASVTDGNASEQNAESDDDASVPQNDATDPKGDQPSLGPPP